MPANRTCRASRISYRALSNAYQAAAFSPAGKRCGEASPATREMPYPAGCRLPLTLPDTAPRLCAGSRCRPQLLHKKPEALRTSEVQVLFANIKNLPACQEGQNNVPFVSQLNLQNKA